MQEIEEEGEVGEGEGTQLVGGGGEEGDGEDDVGGEEGE